MSDFLGLWRLDGQPPDEREPNSWSASLDGRGVLAARVWRDDTVTIIHCQHCFTPEDLDERMPWVSPAGSVIAADLRLDNRNDLIKALTPRDGTAAPDGVLAAHAFDRWGEAAPSHLNGPYAIALWQPQQRRLVLTRDPLSACPLFYYRGPRFIAFATKLAALLALPGVPCDLDEAVIAELLIVNTGAAEVTPYRAVYKVPKGAVVTLTVDGTRTEHWWSLPEPGSQRFACYEDTVAAARDVLFRTVRAQTRAIGRVGSCLTGGLDSTGVTLAAHHCLAPDRLIALTREPDGPTAPESPKFFTNEVGRAAEFAALHPALAWQAVRGDGNDWGEWDRLHWFAEARMPATNPTNVAWLMPLYRAVHAAGGRALLTGDRGNFFYSFAASGLEQHLLQHAHLLALWRSLKSRRKAEGTSFVLLAARQLGGLYEPLWLRSLRKRDGSSSAQPWASYAAVHPAFAAEIGLRDRLEPRIRGGFRFRTVDDLRAWVAGDDSHAFAYSPLRALNGLDLREPLMDRGLVAFFASLPLEAFVHEGVPRSLARDILKGEAPERTIANRKTGRQLSDWHAILTGRQGEMRQTLATAERSPLARHVVDLPRLRSLLDDWPADAASAEPRRNDCFFALSRGLEYARFLAWHDGIGR